jgi:hypothetical protein
LARSERTVLLSEDAFKETKHNFDQRGRDIEDALEERGAEEE